MSMTQEMSRTPEAIAEVFWLAFKGLNEVEQKAALKKLEGTGMARSTIVLRPVHILKQLQGLVAWGGDAVEDSERLYDDLVNLCQELGIDTIASFDQDFDRVGWLKRVSKSEDL